jgi:hypothetical protein
MENTDTVKHYEVVDADSLKLVSWYNNQAPATSLAKARRSSDSLVIERTYALVESKVVRRVKQGKVVACS